MAKRIHVDPAALEEVNQARRTLEESRALGTELLETFESTSLSIQDAPSRFSWLMRTRAGFDVRGVLLRRFHYRVVFVDLPGVVWVIAFAHEKRRPFYWLTRLEGPAPE